MWCCQKCKREFQKTNQSHSCRPSVSIDQHFQDKPKARELFEYLKLTIEKEIGPFKIDCPACCIHLVKTTTFCACWALTDKIRIDFSLEKEISMPKALKIVKLSANRYIYYVDINQKDEVSSELISLIKQSYNLS